MLYILIAGLVLGILDAAFYNVSSGAVLMALALLGIVGIIATRHLKSEHGTAIRLAAVPGITYAFGVLATIGGALMLTGRLPGGPTQGGLVLGAGIVALPLAAYLTYLVRLWRRGVRQR